MTNERNLKMKYDPEYIRHVESGESAAVFIVRDIIKSIDTSNKWIDVVMMSAQHRKGGVNFDYIIIELFNRTLSPQYTNNIGDRKYITWKTAHEDIEKQRLNGCIGLKYLILCDLYNENEGRFREKPALWNKTFERWVPWKWKTSSCEVRKRKIPLEAKWNYKIRATKKISIQQYEKIQKNENKIRNEINSKNIVQLSSFYL